MAVTLDVCGQTHVGAIRHANEDSFVVADLSGGNLLEAERVAKFEIGERGVLVAVSDGMGGHQAGEVASALVVESLRRSMASPTHPAASDALMKKAVERANREVWTAAHEPGQERMGATLTAVFLHNEMAYIAEVGDSRAYLLRARTLEQVTRDQSYVQLLVDSGAMTAKEAQVSTVKNVILQAMGQKPTVTVAMGRIELRRGDCFVLCSDGLTNKVPDAEIRQIVQSTSDLDVACGVLIDLANQRGGEDNITVILARVGGELPIAKAADSITESLEVLQSFELPAAP